MRKPIPVFGLLRALLYAVVLIVELLLILRN